MFFKLSLTLNILQKFFFKNNYKNEGDFLKLKQFFTTHSITHFLTISHTHEHNDNAKRKYRHIRETSLYLLHNTYTSKFFWTNTFVIATYLINCLTIPTLSNIYPYEMLFNKKQNYNKLKAFGCLCYLGLNLTSIKNLIATPHLVFSQAICQVKVVPIL